MFSFFQVYTDYNSRNTLLKLLCFFFPEISTNTIFCIFITIYWFRRIDNTRDSENLLIFDILIDPSVEYKGYMTQSVFPPFQSSFSIAIQLSMIFVCVCRGVMHKYLYIFHITSLSCAYHIDLSTDILNKWKNRHHISWTLKNCIINKKCFYPVKVNVSDSLPVVGLFAKQISKITLEAL